MEISHRRKLVNCQSIKGIFYFWGQQADSTSLLYVHSIDNNSSDWPDWHELWMQRIAKNSRELIFCLQFLCNSFGNRHDMQLVPTLLFIARADDRRCVTCPLSHSDWRTWISVSNVDMEHAREAGTSWMGETLLCYHPCKWLICDLQCTLLINI